MLSAHEPFFRFKPLGYYQASAYYEQQYGFATKFAGHALGLGRSQ
jgi:hypothetical protein